MKVHYADADAGKAGEMTARLLYNLR